MLRSSFRAAVNLFVGVLLVGSFGLRAAEPDPNAAKPAEPAKAEAPKAPAGEAKPADPAKELAPPPAVPAKEAPKAKEEAKPAEPPKTPDKPAPDKPAKDAPPAGKDVPPAPADKEKPAADAGPPAEVFAKKLAEWKGVIKELRKLKADYQTSGPDKLPEIAKNWNEQIAKGEALLPQLREAGKKAFVAAPNQDKELTKFLIRLVSDDVARDDYDAAVELSQPMLKAGCDDKDIFDPAGVAAFGADDFDKADEYFKKAKEKGTLSALGTKCAADVENYKGYWEDEVEIRRKEAEQKDQPLPRVELTTSKGKMTVELFENEAPGAVGNFISLVEKGFYNDKVFHRVLPNFMAQGGCPKGDGTGDAGYKIYCECHNKNYRKHFRGTLSMAHAGRDTGGSQFFITFLATPHLNGQHTAFGRVIEGLDVLTKLQRIDPQGTGSKPTPDKIIEAKVIRKRNHPYEPNKVK